MAQRNERNPGDDRSPASKHPDRRRDNANQGTEGGGRPPAEQGGRAERPELDRPRGEQPEKGGRGDAGRADRAPEVGEPPGEGRESNAAADRARRGAPVSSRS
jgi:hypothetical protein